MSRKGAKAQRRCKALKVEEMDAMGDGSFGSWAALFLAEVRSHPPIVSLHHPEVNLLSPEVSLQSPRVSFHFQEVSCGRGM